MLDIHGRQTTESLKANDVNLDREVASRSIQQNAKSSAPQIIGAEKNAEKNSDKVSAKLGSLILNAELLIKHQEPHLALNLLRTASNMDSKNLRVLLPLANVLERLHKYDEAVIVRKVIFQIGSTCEDAANYAHALYRLNRDQEAKDMYFEALIRMTSDFAGLFEVYKNLGNILVREADYDGAEEYYNKAYTLNASSDVLLVNYGTLDVQRQDYQRAVECFRQAVQINPKNDKAWVGLALVHRHFGDLDLSWANIESAIDLNPANKTAVHVAAQWAVQDQRITQGIQYLQNYLASAEADQDMSLVLINFFCMVNDFECALMEIERVTLLDPRNLEVIELKKKIKSLQPHKN